MLGDMMVIAVRALGAILGIVLGALGMLVLSSRAIPIVLGSGVISGLVACCAAPSLFPRIVDRAASTGLGLAGRVAAATVVGCYVIAGLVAAFGGAALLLVVVAAATVAARRRWRAGEHGHETAAWRAETASAPEAGTLSPPARIERMPIDELCSAWRNSFLLVRAGSSPSVIEQIAKVRCRYLDELERRDPIGFRRWIDSGARAAGDPSRFIRDDRGSTTARDGESGT